MKLSLTLLTLGICALTVQSLQNGLGKTPQMGWNSWKAFGCDVNETAFKDQVDQIV
jgi:alpha-galactosidase